MAESRCNVVLVRLTGQRRSINIPKPALVLDVKLADCPHVETFHLYGVDDVGRLVYRKVDDPLLLRLSGPDVSHPEQQR